MGSARMNGTRTAVVRQSKAVDVSQPDLSTTVATVLALLRCCIHEKGWTLDALEAEMDIDKSLISRMLNGERPMTLAFVLALPDDVEALFEARRAEGFGQIVVTPVAGEQAVKNLISGLCGVLNSGLPLRAGKPIKVNLP